MVEELEGGGQWRRSALEKIVAEVDQGATWTYPGGLLKFLLLVQQWIRYGRTSGFVLLFSCMLCLYLTVAGFMKGRTNALFSFFVQDGCSSPPPAAAKGWNNFCSRTQGSRSVI